MDYLTSHATSKAAASSGTPYSHTRSSTDFPSATKHVHVLPSDSNFGWYIATIILLVLLGGLFSGLTLGLMGLDSVCDHVLPSRQLLTMAIIGKSPGFKSIRDSR
jgi:hypothetical protein